MGVFGCLLEPSEVMLVEDLWFIWNCFEIMF